MDLQLADWLTYEICKFAICRSIKKICRYEICELAYLRNLRIFNCKLSPRVCKLAFCEFKKNICAHLCKFAAGINDTNGNLPLVSMTQVVNLPPVSATPVMHLELRIFSRILFKKFNGPTERLRGLGKTDSCKNLKSKISWHCFFKLPFAHTKLYIVKATDLVALFL